MILKNYMAEDNGSERNEGSVGLEDRTIINAPEDADEKTPSRPQYKPPYLVVVDGPRAGAHFPLSDGVNVLGRAPNVAVRLDDQSVSRQHAEVSRSASGWMLKDLGSKNGTDVNGRPVVDSVVIGHKDVVRVGIYQLRLVTQPIEPEEEMAIPKEFVGSDRTVFVSAPPDGQTAQMEDHDIDEPEEDEGDAAPQVDIGSVEALDETPKKKVGRREIIMIAGLLVVAISVGAYFTNRIFFKAKKTTEVAMKAEEDQQVQTEQPSIPQSPDSIPTSPQPVSPETGDGQVVSPPVQGGEGVLTPGQVPQLPATTGVAPTPAEQAAPAATVPVFLDFASSPMSAAVKFKGGELGKTPVRINVELEPDKQYQAEAVFDMPELKQSFTQNVDFTFQKGANVVPIFFKGPIGILKVNNLPRDAEFYLEGKFTYDKFQEKSAKLTEIVLQKPIYIPYGEYFLELRRTRKLGETSQTFVSDIVFRRDFVIAAESPSFELDVKDEDLKTFPVKIRTEPENSDVFIDGKKVGKTPYEGMFPLGEHRLSIQKEGYFEHSEDLKVDINTPYVAHVKLKTSISGAHINNARLAMDRQVYQEAINELAEALNSGPAPTEIARANYMLGVCYLKLNDIQRAMGYFEQAKENEELKYQAMLGIAQSYAILERMDKTLPVLVEVLLKAKDEQTKKEANNLFQKVSPFKSVVYIYSDPAGADVVVNDKLVGQKTPVILHEMPLGAYRIHLEKPGYLPTDLNVTLSVNEFNPVIVKLKPIPK